MIAKYIISAKKTKGALKKCITYITRADRIDHRTSAEIGNSIGDTTDVSDFIKEVEAVAKMNAASKASPLAHVVLSFHPSDIEGLSNDQLQEFIKGRSEECALALGLGNNQRIAVMHGNTDHPHIHIVFNKVEPERFTMIEPYYPFKRLQTLCKNVEKKLNLVPDLSGKKSKHADGLGKNDVGAKIEANTGIKSLSTWIKSEVSPSFEEAFPSMTNWDDLHRWLAASGLNIRPKANGMVVGVIDTKLHIKASDLSRNASMSKLVKKLGEFEAAGASVGDVIAEKKFGAEPITPGTILFAEFQKENTARGKIRDGIKKNIKDLQNDTDILRSEKNNERKAIRDQNFSKNNKAKLLKQSSDLFDAKAEIIKQKIDDLKAIIERDCKHMKWKPWLEIQANKGDLDAIDIIKKSEKAKKISKSRVDGGGGSVYDKHRTLMADREKKRDSLKDRITSLGEKKKKVYEDHKDRAAELISLEYQFMTQKKLLDQNAEVRQKRLDALALEQEHCVEALQLNKHENLVDYCLRLSDEGDSEATEELPKLIAKKILNKRNQVKKGKDFHIDESTAEGTLICNYDTRTRIKIQGSTIDIDNPFNDKAILAAIEYVSTEDGKLNFTSVEIEQKALRIAAEHNVDAIFENKKFNDLLKKINDEKSKAYYNAPKSRNKSNLER